MLSSPVSSPVSPSWSLVLGTLCSGSIPPLWGTRLGPCQWIPCLWGWHGAAGCCCHGSDALHQGMVLPAGSRCCRTPRSTQGSPGPPDVLTRFSQITPLAADRTDHPCKIAHLHLGRFELQTQVLEPKEEWHHYTMHCTNPSVPGESSNIGGDVLVMAISLSGTSTTRSKVNGEWQSFPNEHVSHLRIENTHPSVPSVSNSCLSAPGISFLSALASVGNVVFFFLFLAYSSREAPSSGLGPENAVFGEPDYALGR